MPTSDSADLIADTIRNRFNYYVTKPRDDYYCVELPDSLEAEATYRAIMQIKDDRVVISDFLMEGEEHVLLADPKFYDKLRGALGRHMLPES